MRKPRSDSKLLHLPEEHQAKLAEWLLSGVPYHVARELIAAAPPDGFGLVVGLSAFSSFWQEVCAPLLLVRRSRAAFTANEIATAASANPGQFDQATIDALKQKSFELSISPGADPRNVKALFSLVLKARAQDLDQQQLSLDREKFEFDAAKRALAELPALKQIAADQSLDDGAKLLAVRQRLFGVTPE